MESLIYSALEKVCSSNSKRIGRRLQISNKKDKKEKQHFNLENKKEKNCYYQNKNYINLKLSKYFNV